MLGYNRPYFAFGQDLLRTPAEQTWAVNYNNGIYRFKTDRMLQHNLVGKVPEQTQLELQLKSIIQQYMHRMTTNTLTIKSHAD